VVDQREAGQFRQLAELMDSAQEIGRTEGLVDDEVEILKRWMRLRKVLHA
jgi:hypothetical protein